MIDIYRLLHSTTGEYTFSSSSHGTLTKTHHIIGPSEWVEKKIEIIQCLLSGHNTIKLEMNNKKITGKSPNLEI